MNKFAGFLGGEAAGFFRFFFPMMILLVVWSLLWKGLALWHAGRKGQPWWFVILLVVNTMGILEIIYLFAVLKMKFSKLFKK